MRGSSHLEQEPDALERARLAEELSKAIGEWRPEVVRIRGEAIQEARRQGVKVNRIAGYLGVRRQRVGVMVHQLDDPSNTKSYADVPRRRTS